MHVKYSFQYEGYKHSTVVLLPSLIISFVNIANIRLRARRVVKQGGFYRSTYWLHSLAVS